LAGATVLFTGVSESLMASELPLIECPYWRPIVEIAGEITVVILELVGCNQQLIRVLQIARLVTFPSFP
jgi:hypothetical protein